MINSANLGRLDQLVLLGIPLAVAFTIAFIGLIGTVTLAHQYGHEDIFRLVGKLIFAGGLGVAYLMMSHTQRILGKQT